MLTFSTQNDEKSIIKKIHNLQLSLKAICEINYSNFKEVIILEEKYLFSL